MNARRISFERILAQWVEGFPHAQPEAGRARARDAFQDIVACIVGGSVEPPTRAVIEVAKGSGQGRALGLGSNLRLPAAWAALVGATAAHALDFDDNFGPAATHATAVLAPALFALAEEANLGGHEVIDSYIVGLELHARIGGLANPSHYETGWHATSTIGAIGSAGACAHLLGLKADQILAAMSIASSTAGGSKIQFGSMMKPIHAGLAAKHAVLAARLAEAGIRANPEPLSGRLGFMDLYRGRRASVAWALEGLGTRLAIETDGVLLKRYPCCGAAHRTLDGLLELKMRHAFAPEDVSRIEVFIPQFAKQNLRFDDPVDENEARFSLPYCAARVLQKGNLSLADMTSIRVRDPELRRLTSRIVIHTTDGSVSEELGGDASPALSRVELTNGRIYEIGIRFPKGSIHAPLTDEDKRLKFQDCCRWAGHARASETLYELARSVYEFDTCSEFTRAFEDAFSSA